MENWRKRIKIRVIKNSQDFIKYTSRPTCINRKVFENNLAASHERKTSWALNKPIYVWFTVLETSKWEMWNLYHNFIIINLSDNSTLDYYLLTQTVYVMNYMKKNRYKKIV